MSAGETGCVRLQKFLSGRGVASRRHAAELIAAGRVTVDGAVVREPGFRVDPAAHAVCMDGRPVPSGLPPARTIVLHKPRGCVCSRRGLGARTVYDLLPAELQALVTVGRLDKDSEGVLLLSSDGALVNRLTHPRFGHPKTYRAVVSGGLEEGVLRRLRSRMVIDGYRIRSATVRVLPPAAEGRRATLEFTLHEGRNRQVRKMCETVGLRVHRLVRTDFAGIGLTGLSPGCWRDVSARERRGLEQA